MNAKKILSIILISFLFINLSIPSFARTQSDFSFIDLEGDIQEVYYQRMLRNYCKIPLNVRENFQLAGWKILITTTELETTMFKNYNITNVCAGIDPAQNLIALECSTHGVDAVVHEVGHFVYYLVGVDKMQNWNEIYKQEAGFISEYAKTSPNECFAEAYYISYMYPDIAKRDFPLAYQYCINISSLVKGITAN